MRRLPAVVAILALVAFGATACEETVSGQVLFAGDFTATDSSSWVTEAINLGGTGLLPTVNALGDARVSDVEYWEARLPALDEANDGFDVAVFSLGMNDVGDGQVTPDLVDRIGAVADAAAGDNHPVVWTTLNEASPGHQAGAVEFNAALRAAAASRPTLHVIDFGAELQAHADYLATDGLRWTTEGQRAFGAVVEAELETIDLFPGAALTVEKTADESSVVVGDPIHYHVTVTNTGDTALSSVILSDPGAAGCGGSVPALAVGAVHTIDCTYTTTAADVGTHHNTATVDTAQTLPVTSEQVDVAVTVPATMIRGTVSESDAGPPVAGAWVAVLHTSDFSIGGGATADANGDFSAQVAPGSYYLYMIDPSGTHASGFFGPPTTVTVTAGNAVDADPAMAPSRGSVTGTVAEQGSGTPIGGAWALSLSAATGVPETSAVADGSGEFTLAGAAAGNHLMVYVDPSGSHATRFYGGSTDANGSTPVAVTGGSTTTASQALPTQTANPGGSTLSGTVSETDTNIPLAGVDVMALNAADFTFARAAVTNASGEYSLDVSVGDYRLVFFDSTGLHNLEWHSNRPYYDFAGATSVTAPAVIDAELDPNTGTMAGTVTDDPAGTPVAGAWVIAIGPSGIAGGVTTTANGTYTLSGLPAGTYRAAFIDPTGGHGLEYFDNAPTYAGATPFNITDTDTTIINADLPSPKPNVVLILTDDQTLESMRVMPHVQELLTGQGTTFGNYVDTFPLCCPTRATLLTGQYAHNHHVVNNVAVSSAPSAPVGGSGALDHTNTLATWLHAGGYQTAHVGKYLNCYGNDTSSCRAGAPAVPPGWDDWFALIDPYPAGYDYFEFDVTDNGEVRHLGPAADIYQTDVLADRAVTDIARLSEDARPFFLNIWTQAPHTGTGATAPNGFAPAPAPRHTGLFTDEPAPATPAVGEADVSDKPAYIRCTFGLTPGEPAGPGCSAPPTSTWTSVGLAPTYRATLQSLQAVDELVGRVVETLAATGELDNTVIVYTSDNGYTFGEHRLNYRKIVPYEESVHVPLVIRGPGFPEGQVAPQVVGNIDIAPTITDITGVTAGLVVDGRSLVPIAEDPAVASGRALLLEDWPNGAFVGIPPHYDAVRTSTDVYIEYATGESEYYDLVNDPYQLTSLHADPSTATRRAALSALIAQLKTCGGASCEVTAPP